MKTHALVVFSGCPDSGGLAADFIKISKQLISDGLNPTCLSTQDLYGSEDMSKQDVHTVNDPVFYQHVHSQLRDRVIDWVTQASAAMQKGDEMIIVMAAHEEIFHGIFLLKTAQDEEFLRVEELYLALKHLPTDVRILFINLVCFSKKWGALANKLEEGQVQEILTETASSSLEASKNHRTMSNRAHYSCVRCAFVNEIVIYPDTTVREHTQRIREEMKCLPDDDNRIIPQCFPAPRGLLSGATTQFISIPNMLQYILTIVSIEDMAKAQLKIRQAVRAKQCLKKLLDFFGIRDLVSNNKTDAGAVLIRNYIDELGPNAYAGEKSDLVEACFDALKGAEGQNLKEQVVHTIMWQRRQLSLVSEHLLDLKIRGYLSTLLDLEEVAKESARELDDTSLKVYTDTHDRLWSIPCVRGLLYSSGNLVPICFQDGYNFLLQNIFFNQMLDPLDFQIDQVLSATQHFFTNSANLFTPI